MKTMLKIALAAAATVAAFGAAAQDYPAKDKTITIVVPYAAGGPTDRVARDLAEALRKPLGGVHPENYGPSGKNWYAGQPIVFHRSPLRVDVDLGTPDAPQIVTLFVVHHKSGRYSAYWRDAEAAGTAELLKDLQVEHPDRPVLVLGDFNALTTDPSVQTYLKAGFDDIFAKRSGGDEAVSHESGRRIDLILANGPAMAQLLADQAFVLGTAARPGGIDWRDLPTFVGLASDHYPVAVDFGVEPGAAPRPSTP